MYFYKYVLDKYKIEANELLFLDDNMENINKAKELGMQTIKVEKNSNLVSEVELYIKDK